MSQPSQSPFSGQPYSGEPAYGQPHQDQPYQNQPYQNQPYQGEQYQAPQYEGHHAAQYGQTTPYGQTPYGQPIYGGPTSGLPPKKKSKVLPIVLTSVAIVLVLCVGGVAVFSTFIKDKTDDLTAAAEPAGSTKAAAAIRIVEPATLGGRPKLTDAQFASAADQVQQGLKKVPGTTKSVGALYGTVSKRNIVIVAAAQAPIANPKRELDAAFYGAGVGGLKISNISAASTGSLGGAAKCGRAVEGDVPMVICSWADAGSLGMFIWYFTSMSKAKAEFPKLRAQVERKG